jgi:hypothetical protein
LSVTTLGRTKGFSISKSTTGISTLGCFSFCVMAVEVIFEVPSDELVPPGEEDAVAG